MTPQTSRQPSLFCLQLKRSKRTRFTRRPRKLILYRWDSSNSSASFFSILCSS